MAKELEEGLDTVKMHKRFCEWLRTSLEKGSGTVFLGAVPAVGFAMAFRRAVARAKGGARVWAEKIYPASLGKKFVDMFDAMYRLQAYMSKGNHCSMQPLAFGCAELRIVQQGSEFVGAIRLPSNASYKDFVKDGQELRAKLHEEGNCSFEAVAGDVLLLPSGFVYISWTKSGCLCYRRSISPDWPCEDTRVQSTVALMLEAHPSLVETAWNDWHGFLLGQR